MHYPSTNICLAVYKKDNIMDGMTKTMGQFWEDSQYRLYITDRDANKCEQKENSWEQTMGLGHTQKKV